MQLSLIKFIIFKYREKLNNNGKNKWKKVKKTDFYFKKRIVLKYDFSKQSRKDKITFIINSNLLWIIIYILKVKIK